MTSTVHHAHMFKSHVYAGFEHGPRVIILGAVHGNEICGTLAIERLMRELDSGELTILRGRLTLVPVTNPLAHARVQRNGDRNLNRNLAPTNIPHDFEDRIANVLCPLLADQDVLLDLHSTTNPPGQPFIMLGPQNNNGELLPFARAAEEEALALRLGPTRIVEGWLDTYAEGVKTRLAYADASPSLRARMLSTDPCYGVGTTEYTRMHGGYALTLECGQHADPDAPEVAYRAIRNTLAHLGLIDAPAPQQQQQFELLKLSQVVDRLDEGDRFVREWASFDRLQAGEVIGHRGDGTPVAAPDDGYIVFPSPIAVPGNEWFYFARISERKVDGLQGKSKL
ncbi:succinylglutamate desuccinylase/aspartoacylase family protein [Chitinilyticum piscinae]|uniref:Succinylglutamate desuccinylase/aspartoacylase family protein n=1 Tax=Chitinilyticum piscinae TaxID=2866724 RepID=A0A8J7FG10_9NEIS|nr:succinylglutamate desuccinylase/aspartoacylase family protein [Chitinilyticum piscinae]MBE9608380.1 succinylglutamate desuccinylase/aspartoacylase family protein [Chitinilyticum piscinae]